MDETLAAVIAPMLAPPAPPSLANAVRHAVLNGGSRIRPRLCLAVYGAAARLDGVAGANGRALAENAASAIELLHCASLVHDDLPCFDNADLRRGKPTVHAVYGEATAVLVGDALIMRAYDLIGAGIALDAGVGLRVFQSVNAGVGMPRGITAGQGWEAEDSIDLDAYHHAKTGALFVSACKAGALAGGGDEARWASFGTCIGRAYQVADDLKDCLLSREETGKPVQQDARLARPNAVDTLGLKAAQDALFGHLAEAIDIAGPRAETASLRSLVTAVAAKVLDDAHLSELKAIAGERSGRQSDRVSTPELSHAAVSV
ncbi:MAG: polyprenyl synthetase family protein [Pseudomonadota bacterium]